MENKKPKLGDMYIDGNTNIHYIFINSWEALIDLKAIRAQKGWTQNQMAEYLGVSSKTIKNWEQGVCKISGPAKILLQQLVSQQSGVPDGT